MEQHPLAGLEPAAYFAFLKKFATFPTAPGIPRPSATTWSSLPGTGAFASGRMNGTTWSFFSPARPAMRTIPR